MNKLITLNTIVSRSIIASRPRYYATAAETIKKGAQALKEDGAVGKEFTPTGSVGGTMNKLGGPFDKNGAIGKQFTTKGAIGGAGQEVAEKVEGEAKKAEKKK